MWVLIVAALTTSAAAISALERPAAISLSTSTSRLVRVVGERVVLPGAAEGCGDEALLDRGVEVGAAVGDLADRAFDFLGTCVLGEVAARARL